jgi:hypothetical protein
MSADAESIPSTATPHRALLALLGAVSFFIVALPAPDLLSGAIPYLLEGHYTFKFRSMRAITVAGLFGFIIPARSLLVWGYSRWARRRGLFSVRMVFARSDFAWCIAAAIGGAALNFAWMHFSGEAHHFTWEAFTRYWGTLPGIGNTILQYGYYVTEGFAIVWLADSFQNAGGFAFPRLRFPWGALGLMVTWGALHYLSKGLSTAIYAVSLSVIIGLLHLANRKSIWPSLVFWLVMTGG